MTRAKGVKNEIAGKTERLAAESSAIRRLDDEGKAQAAATRGCE